MSWRVDHSAMTKRNASLDTMTHRKAEQSLGVGSREETVVKTAADGQQEDIASCVCGSHS